MPNTSVTLICPTCGKEFVPNKRNHWLHCSNKCKNDYVITKIRKICENPPTDGCALLESVKNYGKVVYEGKRIYAHRASYMIYHGPIPSGAEILHSCDVRNCVNPLHLSAGSHLDNMLDAASKKRMGPKDGALKGAEHVKAKLTEEQVLEIRRDYIHKYGSLTALARKYGVRSTNIRSIVNRITWKHI